RRGLASGFASASRRGKIGFYARLLAEQAVFRLAEFPATRRGIPIQPQEDPRSLSPEARGARRGRARRRAFPRRARESVPPPVLFRRLRHARGRVPRQGEEGRGGNRGEVQPWLSSSASTLPATRR